MCVAIGRCLSARAHSACMGESRTRVATNQTPCVRAASRCVAEGHTCALLDDKSVKCFGDNHMGQLGLGDTTNRNTPTAVTALGTSVVQMDIGSAHTPGTRMLCVFVCVHAGRYTVPWTRRTSCVCVAIGHSLSARAHSLRVCVSDSGAH